MIGSEYSMEVDRTYGIKRPMEMDQRILTGKRADVLQTIHRKDDNCPIQIQIVRAAEPTRNERYASQYIIVTLVKGRWKHTGGEVCADKLIPASTRFTMDHITTIADRASTLRKKRLLRAVFLMSTLYAVMMKPCDMKNNSTAASTVYCSN
jgi:hypothetical protein